MKRLISRIRSILGGTSGETLMEGIVAILILSTLLTTVTFMIQISLAWTAKYTRAGELLQEAANAAVALNIESGSENLILTSDDGSINTLITIGVDMAEARDNDGNIIHTFYVFGPVDTGGGP